MILYLQDLTKDLSKTHPVKAVQIRELKPQEIYELCNCGCSRRPIAEIYIIFKTKKSGIRIYPSPCCELVILDCENKGALIDLELYDTVKNWLITMESEMARHIKRTALIKLELVSKVFKPVD